MQRRQRQRYGSGQGTADSRRPADGRMLPSRGGSGTPPLPPLSVLMLLLVAAALVLGSSALPVMPTAAFAQPAGLELLRRSPDDGDTEIAPDAALLVQFSAPVQPLTALPEAPDREVVRISPPVAGLGRWLTSSMYRFDPAAGWQPSSRYTVAIAPGLTDARGAALVSAPSWSFSTITPAVVAVSPVADVRAAPTAPGDPNLPIQRGPAPPTTRITVWFNQPVDKAAAQAALRCSPVVAGRFDWPDDKTMQLVPEPALPRGGQITCNVAAGVPALTGGAATAQERGWSISVLPAAGITNSVPSPGGILQLRQPLSLTFASPMDQESVEQRLTFEPAVDDVRYAWFGTTLNVQFAAKPRDVYQLTLASGAVDSFGDVIRALFTLRFTIAPLPTSINLSNDSYYAVAQAGVIPAVSIISVNTDGTTLKLSTITEGDYRAAVVNQPPPGPEAERRLLREWRVSFDNPPLDDYLVTRVPLADAPLEPGYYLLEMQTLDPRGPIARPFMVTRTHLTLKFSYDQLMIWALDYATGEPLTGLPVQVHGSSAPQEGRTDASGLLVLPAPTQASTGGPLFGPAGSVPFPAATPPFWVTAERPGDVVYAHSSWRDSGGFPYPPSFTGVTITDRPLYRPGETVFVSGYLRVDADVAMSVPPAEGRYDVVLSDNRGRELSRRTVSLDSFGGFAADFTLAADAPTGNYNLRIDSAGRPGIITIATFQVAEFRRPEFSVTVKTERGDYTSGDTVAATAAATLFFGAPVQDGVVDWRMSANPLNFAPRDYPGYSFADSDIDVRGGPSPRVTYPPLPSGSATSNRSGIASFGAAVDISAYPTSQVVTVEATVRDASGQAISNRTTTRVHSAERYVGLRPTSYVNIAGQPAAVNLVTVDQQAQPAPGETLTVRVVERRWEYVQRRGPDGNTVSEYQPVDREVDSRPVVTGTDGAAAFSFVPDRGGFYRVTATGRDGSGRAFRAATGVWVASKEFVPWRFSGEFQLTMVTDRTEYQPGETAKVLVQAPFAGATGLVTVERGGILSRQVRRFDDNSTVLDIPLERVSIPNVFVSVVLFKAGESSGQAAQYRSGNLELKVSPEGRRLNIQLTPSPEQTGPRGTITFAVKTTDAAGNPVPAELTMALVDEAILSLTEDRTVDLFNVLYGARRHGVATSADVRGRIFQVQARAFAAGATATATPTATPARTATPAATAAAPAAARPAAPQGGAADEEANVEVRSDFRYTAHFEAALRTDANGDGRLVVQMPDTLTLWRMTARGITIDTLAGIARAQVTTVKPLVLRPVAPRFFTAADRPDLGAVLLNQSDAPVDVRVSLRAVDTPATGTAPAVRAGVTVDGDPVQTLRLPAGAQGTVYWPARVGEPAGEAGAVILRWTAVAGALNDAVELTIPVYAFATPEYVASSGAVRSETTEVVRGPATPGIQASDVTLNLWPSLVAALPETVRWVQEYPWRSNEWYASTLLTVLGLAKAGGSAPDATLVRSWVDWLQEGQESDGGWSWWPGDRYAPVSNPSLSAHVLLALTTARDADVAVNSDRLRRAAQYLRNQLDAQRDLHPNLRAAMVYALVTVDPAELTRAERAASERDSIGPLAKAFLVLAMRRAGVAADDQRLRPLLSDLISSAAISAAAANWDDDRAQGYWSNPTFTTAVAMQALARTDVEHPLVDNAIRWLMNERREGRWSSARDSAMAVLALGAVAEARGEAAAAFTYRVLLNNTPVSEGNVPRAGAAPATAITLRDAVQPGDNPLTISKNSAESGRLYYQLSYRTLRPGEEIGSLDRGLAVAHEILSAEDKPLRAAKTGDIVKVRVTVIAPSSMNYVQVEDFLPGGLEILDPSLRTTTGAVGDLLRGERERQAQLQRAACRVFYGACRAPWSHVDFRDDRVALFASSLPKGVHEYVYYARAAAPGKYVVRPSRVWETYFPDVFGRTDSGAFVVEP